VATFGLQALAEVIEDVAHAYGTRDRVDDVIGCLKQIHQHNVGFAMRMQSKTNYRRTHEDWRKEVQPLVARLLNTVNRMLNADEPPQIVS
jgi:hypothetical protein